MEQLLLFETLEPVQESIQEPVEEHVQEPIEETVEEQVPESVEEQVEDNNSNVNVATDFLNKFAAIEIGGEQRISEEELAYCQLQEQIYFETRDVLNKAHQEISGLYEKYKELDKEDDRYNGANYLSRYDDLNFCPKRLKEVYGAFVSRITYYFTKRYNVTLSSSDIEKKYTEETITYSVILDEIFEQLGGLTFKEKAVAELKAASRNAIYDKSKVTVTKNKLILLDFVWWRETWSNHKALNYSDSRVRPLFLALSHFISDSVQMCHGLQLIYNQLDKGAEYYDIFSKYEIRHDILESFKFYKNGKVELFFADNAKAENFKKEYLV